MSQLGKDDTDVWMKKLRNRFEKPVKAVSRKLQEMDTKGKGKAKPLTAQDYPRLHQQWCDEFQDIVNGTKGEMPPWREVNHEIHLHDQKKWYICHMPHCPLSLREDLYEKINQYVDSG